MMRKKEGHPLQENQEMKLWRKQYEQMSPEDHKRKLKMLGLNDEEIAEVIAKK